MTSPSPPTQSNPWLPLRDELDRWADSGRLAEFWLRDDDAIEVTPALQTLTRLCQDYAVPCLIATIPQRTSHGLVDYLADHPGMIIAQHGFSHRNRSPAGVKSEEFPRELPHGQVVAELREGFIRLENLAGSKLLPIYVPPWNRISREIAELLPAVGFRGLSVFGHKSRFSDLKSLTEVNVHVDIIDWRGHRGGRDIMRLSEAIACELRGLREAGENKPIGILAHHLVHDDPAWTFLEGLFALSADHPAAGWRSASDLLERKAQQRGVNAAP